MEVVAEDVRFLDTKKSINENSNGDHHQYNQSHDDDPFPGSVETHEEWPF
ncbi:Single-stranded DNA-binding protein [Bacillus sp. ZZV12-4809]|nr:Single-stranded DNA-binding protein [Bacillus sp. ZZV12-4809]